MGVDAEGSLIATADAIGTRERLFVVFQDVGSIWRSAFFVCRYFSLNHWFKGKSAIQTLSSNLFLSLKLDKDGYVHAVSKKVEEDEVINVSYQTFSTSGGHSFEIVTLKFLNFIIKYFLA